MTRILESVKLGGYFLRKFIVMGISKTEEQRSPGYGKVRMVCSGWGRQEFGDSE